MRSPAERILLVQQSVAKFRRAIRLRPEFDRACYNLGTVYYAHACSLQAEVQNPAADQVCNPAAYVNDVLVHLLQLSNGARRCNAFLTDQVQQVPDTSGLPLCLHTFQHLLVNICCRA